MLNLSKITLLFPVIIITANISFASDCKIKLIPQNGKYLIDKSCNEKKDNEFEKEKRSLYETIGADKTDVEYIPDVSFFNEVESSNDKVEKKILPNEAPEEDLVESPDSPNTNQEKTTKTLIDASLEVINGKILEKESEIGKSKEDHPNKVSSFFKNTKTSKRLSFSMGWFQVTAIDTYTGGVLQAPGGSNRLSYQWSGQYNKLSYSASGKLDWVKLSSGLKFKTIENSNLLVSGTIGMGYSSNDVVYSLSFSKFQLPVLGRFGRDPRKDILLTSVPTSSIAANIKFSAEGLFDSIFEYGLIFHGENEHFKLSSGKFFSMEISRKFRDFNESALVGGVIFEGTSYLTEGVSNKDARVLGSIALEY